MANQARWLSFGLFQAIFSGCILRSSLLLLQLPFSQRCRIMLAVRIWPSPLVKEPYLIDVWVLLQFYTLVELVSFTFGQLF
jgi:hypothetical protein